MKDQAKIIAALLVGAAAGAAIGLLLAPSSGTELRGDIADYVNDLVEKSKETAAQKANDLKGYGNSVVDRAKSRVNDVMSNLSDYKDQIRGSIKASANDYTDQATNFGEDMLNKGRSKVKNAVNDVSNNVQGI